MTEAKKVKNSTETVLYLFISIKFTSHQNPVLPVRLKYFQRFQENNPSENR